MMIVTKVLTIAVLAIMTSSMMAVMYDLDVTFVPRERTIEGSVRVSLEGEDPTFLLLPNLSSRDNPRMHPLFDTHMTTIEILGVYDLDGGALSFEITEHPSELLGHAETRKNSLLLVDTYEDELVIDFVTKVSRNFAMEESSVSDFVTWRFGWYPLQTVNFEGFSLPAHEWKLRIDLPEGWKVITSGELQEDELWTSGGVSFSCSITLLKDEFYRVFTLSGRSAEIEVHYRKGQEAIAAAMAAHSTQILDYFADALGPLPHRTVRIVQNPYPGIYGLAADGLIIIGDGLFSTSNLWVPGLLNPLSFYLLAHEIAHLWFGMGVGVDFLRDDFLSEGIAEYLAHVALLEVYGEDTLLNWRVPEILIALVESLNIPRTFRESDQYSILDLSYSGVIAAVDSRADEIPVNYKQHVHYTKAKRAFLMLEDLISRSVLLGVLKEFHSTHFKEHVGGEDLYVLLRDLADERVIDDLFRNPEDLDASVYADSRGIVIDLAGRNVPLRVVVEKREETVSFVATETTILPRDGIKSVTIDPDWHSYDFNRHNNHWPRLFRIPSDEEPGKFDAYTLGLEAGIGFGEGLVFADGIVFVSQFPYWTIGLTSRQYFFAEEGGYAGAYGLLARYAPNKYMSTSLRLDRVSGLEVDVSLSLPESLDIGLAAPILAPRTQLYGLGILRNLDQFLLLGGISFDNLLSKGLYLGAEYGFLRDDQLRSHLLGGMTAYFPNVSWSFMPHISGIHLMEVYSSGPQEVSDSYLRSMYPLSVSFFGRSWRTAHLTNISAGFSHMSYLSKRFNLFNLFSVGGLGVSIEADYIGTGDMNAVGAVLTLAPRFYIVSDTPISPGIMIGVYSLLGEGRLAIRLEFGMSLGSSIFFGVR